jgi:hypothetical protein
MSEYAFEYDLVILAAGKNESEIVRTVAEQRQESLGIRAIRCSVLNHPRRDPGCLRESPQILQTYLTRAARAVVVFDWEGCGREDRTASEIEDDVTATLEDSGWAGRCAVVVIAPELEAWLWISSPHVSRTLGWGDDYAALVDTLERRGFRFTDGKPDRPKEAIELCLRERRIQRSSALYGEIASKVSLNRCVDRSFRKLREALLEWFGVIL